MEFTNWVHVDVLGVLRSFRFILLILLTTGWDIKCLLATSAASRYPWLHLGVAGLHFSVSQTE